MMKNKFEYKRFDVTVAKNNVESTLNSFGKDRWEVIWYEERNQPKEVTHITVLMKRPISKTIL